MSETAPGSEGARSAPTVRSGPGTGGRLALDCGALALAALAAAACIAPALAAARPALMLLAFCLVPGGAVLTLLPARGAAEAATLAVALGLGLLTAGASVMVWSGWWHAFGFAASVGVLAAAALLVDLVRGARGAWR
jgi:hypothetical protein